MESPIALNPGARAEWDRILPILRSMGVLSKGDATALAIYCVAFSEWVEARDEVDDKGSYMFDEAGKYFANPAIAIGNKALDVMTRMLKEFGLTPSSRSGIKAEPVKDVDEFEDFKTRKRKTK